MKDPRVALRRLFASFRSRRMDDELRDEIASHLAEATDEYVRRGMTPEDARVAALRSFGGVTQTEQVHREVRSFAWFADLRQDLRLAGRSFVRNPGFTLVTVLTLALGIGATTMIFTLLDAVIFKPLPVPKPYELFTFYENGPEGSPDATGGTGRFLRFSYGRFERLQQALGSRGSIAAVTRSTRLIVRLPGNPQRRFLSAQFASGAYFATLGVEAIRGRVLTHGPRPIRYGTSAAISCAAGSPKASPLTVPSCGSTIAAVPGKFPFTGIAIAAPSRKTDIAPRIWVKSYASFKELTH